MKTEITRTVTEIIISFKAYDFEKDELFMADVSGYEMTTEELKTQTEKDRGIKILKIISNIEKKYKLTINLKKAIEIGELTEVN